jgi:tRNA A-37 threonylcarbamoyl transferase component Bud32
VVTFKDRSSMLITQALDLLTLDTFLYHGYETMDIKAKLDLSRKLGRLIGRLHSLNIYHADLKACNIMLSDDRSAFFFLDTDRVNQFRCLSAKRRLKNLVQINTSIPKYISKSQRMAFIIAYAKAVSENPKKLFRKIWDLSQGKPIVYTTRDGDKIESWDQDL